MKRLLRVLGWIFLVLIVLLIGGTIYTVLKVRRAVDTAKASWSEIQSLNTAYPFKKPADGKLDPQRLADFMAIRKRVTTELQGHPALQKLANPTASVSYLEIASAAEDLARTIPQTFKSAMDDKQMSLPEYGWYARRLHETIGAGQSSGGPALDNLRAQWQSAANAMAGRLREANATPHAEKLENAIAHLKGLASNDDAARSAIAPYARDLEQLPLIGAVEMYWIGATSPGASSP